MQQTIYLFTVDLKLFFQGFQVFESPVPTYEMNKLHLDCFAIDRIGEMQQMDFDRQRLTIDRRAVADGEHPLVASTAQVYPHGIDSVTRPDLERFVDLDVGRRETHHTTNLTPADDMSFQKIRIRQHLRGFFYAALGKKLPDPR